MARFVGVKNNRICVVSDKPFQNGDLQMLEVPPELSQINPADLIVNCRVQNNKIKCKNFKKPANQMKVALVGNWKMRCGIATYSEHLWPEVIKHVGDFKLFIEQNDLPTGDIHQIGTQILPDSKVLPCWKRGESLLELVQALKDYDPDIIWFQHEFGLWPNAAYWLAMMTQLADYRVIVTMHSVFHHRDKTIVEAAMPEIVVHLDGAYEVLKHEKGVPGKVYVIPHGCEPCTNKERLWNFYKSEHTIIQAGFLFRYKGWEDSLKAIHILKEKYSDVFFTGLCSESDHNKEEHQIYYNELMDLITKLDMQENVALIRGYQSEESWDSYFRTNKIAVFPYVSAPGHEVFGASGAVRVAMSKYLPVITSHANHFSDLPTIKAGTAEQMAQEIDKLFSDIKLVDEQLKKQVDFLDKNSWSKIAEQYIKLFEGD
jgi:glycosyltransferase involved in cell wall biosynthesis